MKSFLIGLQFLTRIKLVKQEVWSDEDFGSSVACFPVVGMVIGLLLCLIFYLLSPFMPKLALAAILVAIEFWLSGGLHADGLMDTCDGYFSGRDRERSLEIMKDSRVGANGVVAFVFLVLLKTVFIASLNVTFYLALFAMPIIGRWLMSFSIVHFPYARPQGIGKAFAEFSSPYALHLATGITLLPIFVFGLKYMLLCLAGFVWMYWLNTRFVKRLGGVTGDTYGAVTESSELLMLFLVVIMENIAWNI